MTSVIETSTPSKTAFLRSFLYWLPPAALALALAIIYLNPFIGDWDGLDYTVLSVHGEPSSMALGRSVFTLLNYALYMIAHNLFGVRPDQAYLIFKFAVVAQVPLAIIMCWILARDLSGSRQSATIAALLSRICPGPGMLAIGTSSSPVESTIIFGRGTARTRG